MEMNTNELAEKLMKWMDGTDKGEVDAVLEWLYDQDMLNQEGMVFYRAFPDAVGLGELMED